LEELRYLTSGQRRVISESEDTRLDGARFHIRTTIELPKAHEHDWRRVFTAVEDITEARALSQQLRFQASHDALTGLVNRREFENRLERAAQSAESGRSEHAVCYLDLDQFKIINDTSGHVAGDELLKRLGRVLAQQVRTQDTLARLGGDEFGVLLEDCSMHVAERVANALRRTIEDFRFVWEKQVFSIGVSIGVVPIQGPGQTVSSILSAADAACYAAKDLGRNRIHIYHEGDVELARRHGEMRWVTRIQTALEENRFELARQPIVPLSASAGADSHYELLLRMRDEDGDIVLPDAFLPAAERYNLSVRLDRWVVREAFRLLTQDQAHLEHLFLCSINLSGVSLADEDFLIFVTTEFASTGLPPGKICFEITETAAIANLPGAMRFMEVLRRIGCRFALDDFGSGLSSFAYLKNLPVDFLKIDGVFVKDIVEDPIDRELVRSINEIGHVMGKRTIAEFVESSEILAALGEIGVDYAQGFELGRPELLPKRQF
jgi:diguanylate cyclase (GGDEF)-like protein